jgi:hypothetical protein
MPAFELHRQGAIPCKAASPIAAGVAVQIDVADTQRQVLPIASANIEPFGITVATALTGQGVSVWDRGNVVKALAAASLGAGANVGVVGATNSLGLIAAGASGSVVWAVGKSMTAAAAGEVFSFYINPRQLSGFAP